MPGHVSGAAELDLQKFPIKLPDCMTHLISILWGTKS
jgi:hypothetical protein